MPGSSSNLRLSAATLQYDHVHDLMTGAVRADGIDLISFDMPIEEIFWRSLKYEEFDVSEMSLGMYTSLVSRGDRRFTAIPVFPSKVFRHSAIFVRTGSGIVDLAQLRGARVGLAQWSQTAATFVRGMLTDQGGLKLEDIDWVQAGVNEAGREEPAVLKLPDRIRLTPQPHKSLDEMLVNGEIDAVISARAPNSFFGKTPSVSRLFDDYVLREKQYYAETGIFPIMHIIVIRTSTYEANRWIARSLYKGFNDARRRGMERLADATASRIAVPWLHAHLLETAGTLGDDPYAYGIEPNRRTLEAFARYTADQGVAHRRIDIEELFANELLTEYRV